VNSVPHSANYCKHYFAALADRPSHQVGRR
jgi:hypothetical protein